MASRSKDIARLKQTVAILGESAQSPGSERISVPSDWIEEFSRIETEEIVRSRTKAISEAAAAPKSGFSILSSAVVLNVKSRLDPDDRLKVEDAIDELIVQPRPRDVEKEADTGSVRLRVPGTYWEIVYAVNDAERQLKLLSLRQAALSERN